MLALEPSKLQRGLGALLDREIDTRNCAHGRDRRVSARPQQHLDHLDVAVLRGSKERREAAARLLVLQLDRRAALEQRRHRLRPVLIAGLMERRVPMGVGRVEELRGRLAAQEPNDLAAVVVPSGKVQRQCMATLVTLRRVGPQREQLLDDGRVARIGSPM